MVKGGFGDGLLVFVTPSTGSFGELSDYVVVIIVGGGSIPQQSACRGKRENWKKVVV